MDFRMRNFKENKQNYNSMVEFPRNVDLLASNGVDYAQNNKFKQMEVRLSNLMESQRVENQNSSNLFFKIEQRVEGLELRIAALDTRFYNKGQTLKDSRNSAPFQSNSNNSDNGYFKQTVIADLTSQRQEIRSQNMKNEQIQMRQLRLEQDLKEWINNHKQQINMRLIKNDQLRGSDLNKQKKYEYQYDNIKSVVHQLEEKFEGELEMKFRGMASIKQQFGQSLQSLREEVSRDSRNDKQSFAKLVRQIKESFQTLKDALGKDRQFVKEAIFQIQTNQQNSVNKSNRSIESLSENWNERQQKLEKRLIAQKDDWNTFKLATNQKLEDFKTLIMTIESTTLQNFQKNKNGSGDSAQAFETMKEQLAEWKKLTQQKNLNVFREISNAMKILRMQWRKQHDELGKEIQQNSKSVKQSRQFINKRVDKELQEMTKMIGEQFDALTSELEQMNDLVALSKKEQDEKLGKQIILLKDTVNAKLGEASQLGQQTMIKIEAAEAKMRVSLKESVDSLKDEISTVQRNSALSIQSLVSSITEDNDQWEKDLKQSVKKLKQTVAQDIRSNVTNLENMYSEGNKKLESSIQLVRKNLETKLTTERSETVKQVSKVTEEITGLIGDWSSKIKKQRETGENSLKQLINQQKKAITQDIEGIKQATQSEKTKAAQRTSEEAKKNAELKTFVQQSIAKVIKSSEEDLGKINKRIDSLKTQLEGKVKLASDKLALDISMKKEFEIKAKEDQSKLKSAELQKKLADINSKLKAELLAEINKATKNIEQDSSKTTKKFDAFTVAIKKQLQTEVEKDKKFCVDEIAKAKGEIQLKMKARDEKSATEANSKKQMQAKQKQEQFKLKLTEMDKKISDTSVKIKGEVLAQVAKVKNTQNEEITKVKNEIQAKLKAVDDQKAKKEADAKTKESQVKEKEIQLKNRAIQLDKKIQTAKKDIQKATNDQISKVKVQFDVKLVTNAQQLETKLNNTTQAMTKINGEEKSERQQLSKKVEQVKQDVSKKIAQLKGVSLVNLKAQEQQANKIQDQKLQNLKLQLVKSITQATTTLQKDSNQSILKLEATTSKLRQQLLSSLQQSKKELNKVEANIFAQKQKNKAVYEKMCSDILDVADSMTIMISELKITQK